MVSFHLVKWSCYQWFTMVLGQVRGTLEKSQNGGFFAQFVGIPYAQPPVGKLRFARPKAWTNSWNDTVLEADQRTLTRCVQLDENTGDVKGTEDCLKLNIYVPRTYKFYKDLILCK